MHHLIKKDILVQKRNIKICLLIMLFFTYTLSSMGPAGFTVSVLAITYMLTIGAFAMDDKNNCDRMLVSLPIERKKIVLSKYLSIFVYAFFASITNVIIYGFLQLLNTPFQGLPISKMGVFAALFAVLLYSSISFPLLFRLGYHQAKMANFLLFFGLVFGGTFLANEIITNPLMISDNFFSFFADRSELELMFITLLPVLIIFIISYFISLKFYQKREY